MPNRPAATGTRRALVFRITHTRNVPWILDNGLHAMSSGRNDPNFIPIGNPDLIAKRRHRQVEVGPGGTLDDYVPFHFGTHSVMLFNIHTKRVVGVEATQRDLVYLVSSMERIRESGGVLVFTDRHAYVANASFFSESADLSKLDWELIKGRDFHRDPNRPDKLERRAAELLVHRHVPLSALLGIACYDEASCTKIQAEVARRGLDLRVEVRRGWYF